MPDHGAPSTLEDLSRRRRENDRPTHVHVVGRPEDEPPTGRDVAERVAELLVDADGSVREEDFGELDDGDVALVTIEGGPRSRSAYEANDELYELASVSQLKILAGIVVHAEGLTSRVENHLDARVWAENGAVDRVEQLEQNAFDGDVVVKELGGIE